MFANNKGGLWRLLPGRRFAGEQEDLSFVLKYTCENSLQWFMSITTEVLSYTSGCSWTAKFGERSILSFKNIKWKVTEINTPSLSLASVLDTWTQLPAYIYICAHKHTQINSSVASKRLLIELGQT